jgi:hypothetical protein
MYDFTAQFIEFFAQLFWGAIYLGMIFLTVRMISFFLMPWKTYMR